MSVFDFATIAVSFILGLAVTYLLESIVNAFRARRTCRLHWLPFTWAGFVLLHLFQFWWALYEVNGMLSISVGVFSLLLFLSALLFLAGALVLPSGEIEYPKDLAEYFFTDGSWGVGAIGLFNLTAILANVLLFKASMLDSVNLLNMLLVVIAVLVVVTRTQVWQIRLTIAYFMVLIFTEFTATISVYTNTALS